MRFLDSAALRSKWHAGHGKKGHFAPKNSPQKNFTYLTDRWSFFESYTRISSSLTFFMQKVNHFLHILPQLKWIFGISHANSSSICQIHEKSQKILCINIKNIHAKNRYCQGVFRDKNAFFLGGQTKFSRSMILPDLFHFGLYIFSSCPPSPRGKYRNI